VNGQQLREVVEQADDALARVAAYAEDYPDDAGVLPSIRDLAESCATLGEALTALDSGAIVPLDAEVVNEALEFAAWILTVATRKEWRRRVSDAEIAERAEKVVGLSAAGQGRRLMDASDRITADGIAQVSALVGRARLALSRGQEIPNLKAILDALPGVLREARESAAERARADRAETDLRHFGNHVPPCPRWITKGSPELNECLCGFDEALRASSGGGAE
jgi:hypothetical protein